MRNLLFSALLLVSAAACAGGFQINTQGQKATAMGGSVTGLALDASAAFFNPGALSSLEHNQFVAGVNAILPRSVYLGPYNGTENLEKKVFTPFSVYGAYKLKGKLTLGLSVNTPFGLGTTWADNWTGRYVSQSARLNAVFIQPTVAYKLNEHMSVGAGPVMALGHAKLSKAIPVDDGTGEAQLKLDGKGSGVGFNLGVFATYGKFNFGLDYRSAVKVDIKSGSADFVNVPSSLIANGTFPQSTSFSTGITLPSVASVGIGYRPDDKWKVNIEFNWTGWSVYDSLNFTFSEYPQFNSHSPRNYKDALALRIGAAYQLNSKLTLRGGVAYDQTPVQDGYVSPELPDNHKTILSCGVGYQYTKHLAFDMAFMYENVKERKETGNHQGSFNGTYKSNITIVGIGAHYEF